MHNFSSPRAAATWLIHEMGFKLFPIKLYEKSPAVKGWQSWAELSKRKFDETGANDPFAYNWGVHTGGSGLVVIDVDDKGSKNGSASLETTIDNFGEPLPATFTVATPSGGKHYYFKCEEKNIRGGVNKLGNGVDVQCRSKYVVAPGSIVRAKDGGESSYYLIDETPPAPLPAWIFKLIEKRFDDTNLMPGIESQNVDSDENIKLCIDYLETAPPCEEGNPDGVHTGEYAFTVFCELRDRGVSLDTARNLFDQYYNPRCRPPWRHDLEEHEEHLLRISRNAYKYAQNKQIGVKTPEAITKRAEGDFDYVFEPGAIYDFDTLASSNPPSRDWIIENWLPAGEISALYGKGGKGKSLLALQMAVGIATGGQFLSLPCQKMPVLAVFCEDDKNEVARRCGAIKSAPESTEMLEQSPKPPLFLMPRAGEENDIARMNIHANDLTRGAFYETLDHRLEEMGKCKKLVILDTLSDIYLADENTRQTVNKFVKTYLKDIAMRHNAAILLIAHPSRAGAKQGDLLSGSTAWENAVRNRLVFNDSDKHKGGEIMALTRHKSNYAKSGEALYCRYEKGRFVLVAQVKLAKYALKDDEQKILEYLSETMILGDKKGVNQIASEMMEKGVFDLSRPGVLKKIERLFAEGGGFMNFGEKQFVADVDGQLKTIECRGIEAENAQEKEEKISDLML